jgi:hypothetical protein
MSYPQNRTAPPVDSVRRLAAPPGHHFTLKADAIVYGDFPPPALIGPAEREKPRPPGRRAVRTPAPGPQPGADQPRRRWRPPRLPEPVYARLRRLAVEVVCCGFIGIAILTIGYHLARTALH